MGRARASVRRRSHGHRRHAVVSGVRLPPFQGLLAQHGAETYRLCAGMVGSQDAADCYQETVLAALRAYPGLRDSSNLRAWLLTIARHKAIDTIRDRRRAGPTFAEPAVAGDANGRRIPRDAAGVPAIAEPVGPVDGDELWARVRRLPPKQSAAMVHRFGADRSYRDIAVLLDCSEEAARRSVHEGLRKLREVYRT